MQRRNFLACSAGAIGALAAPRWSPQPTHTFGPVPPAFEIIPVVADGKWIWAEPPKEKGYLEPREFELSIGIQLEGQGPATNLKATTPVPLAAPEQKIDNVSIECQGCEAGIRQLSSEASQLLLSAPRIVAGQTITATARYKLTLLKQYHGFEKDQFPQTQEVSKEMKRLYLGQSPGIQTQHRDVRELAEKITEQLSHPWEKAKACYDWVWNNIEGRVGRYTNVLTAIRDRVGDCEERAAVFVALARLSGIPARLVWVPNHNWAEIYLADGKGEGHWIPIHTAAYSWFGWTGVHELVLQKGDNIDIPEQGKRQRLVVDWMQHVGKRPDVHYFAELKPLPGKESSDPGPGARSKAKTGEWVKAGTDSQKRLMRR
jgi:hypothetical protein